MTTHTTHTSDTDESDAALQRFMTTHERVFVLTGAGCSTAAGLGDYRNKHGEWKRKQPITGQEFLGSLSARQRYWARSSVGWKSFGRAQPALAHHALRRLQQASLLQALITQNVDQLHQKAGHTDVIDLHGVLSQNRCTQCNTLESRDEFQRRLLDRNPWLNTLTAQHAPDGDADLDESLLQDLDIPMCLNCGGVVKPDVVFFGENVPRSRLALAMLNFERSDALLVCGSSLMVYSGFRFCRYAAEQNKPIALVNDGKTRADDLATVKIEGDCGARLQRLADGLVV